MSYIDLKVPDELKKKVIDFVKSISDKHAKIKKGMNEVTKTIERGIAKFVIIAEDITPAEIVMHLPKIAQEKKIPYCFLSSKGDVGKAAGLKISCSALAIVDFPKEADATLKEIVNDIAQLRK
jgi:large subunit ribosomal protein L7Ae